MLHEAALQAFSAHHEVHMDPGEHLGIGLGSLGVQLYLAPGRFRPALLEHPPAVVGGAAAGADEHHLHRPRREVSPAAVGSSIHRHDMIASGLGKKRHAVAGPSDRAFHQSSLFFNGLWFARAGGYCIAASMGCLMYPECGLFSSTLLLWWIRRNSRELRPFFGRKRRFSQFGD